MSEPNLPEGSPPRADEARDAWLREALRHAPDAAAIPPSALREDILAHARAAVVPRRRAAPTTTPTSAVHLFMALWSWLARPPVAAGFASVMAATLVGMMWWGRPIDDAAPRPASSRVETPSQPAAALAERRDTTQASPPLPSPSPPSPPSLSSPSLAAPGSPALDSTSTPEAPSRSPARTKAATVAPEMAAKADAPIAALRPPVPAPAAAPTTDASADAARAFPQPRPAPIGGSAALRDDAMSREKREQERRAAPEPSPPRVVERAPTSVLPPPAPTPAPTLPALQANDSTAGVLSAGKARAETLKDRAAPSTDAGAAAATPMPFPSTPSAARDEPATPRLDDDGTEAAKKAQAPSRSAADRLEPARAPSITAAPTTAGGARGADALAAAERSEAKVGALAQATPMLRQRAAEALQREATDSAAASGTANAQAFANAAPPQDDATARRERRTSDLVSGGPLARPLASIAAEPARWAHLAVTGDSVPIDAPLRDWLASLDAASAGLWHVVATTTAGVQARANPIVLTRDGRVASVIRLEGDRVVFESRWGSSGVFEAPLAPAIAARLRAALPQPSR